MGSRPTLAGGVAKLMGEGRTVDAPLEAFRKSAHHGRRRRYPGKRRRNGRRRHSCRWREATAVVVAPPVGVRRPDVHHRPKLRFDGIAGAAGSLTSPRARMWLGEAPIGLMLETSHAVGGGDGPDRRSGPAAPARRQPRVHVGRGSGTQVEPGVLARHIGGSPVCTRLAAGGRRIRTVGPPGTTTCS